MRALLLVVLLALTSGCFSDELPDGLAKPTTSPHLPPQPTVKPTPPVVYDDKDPGFNHSVPWHVGDGWDYETTRAPREYHTIRVVEAREADGRALLRVEETFGRQGSPATARVTRWVDAGNWTVFSSTDTSGTTFVYEPPRPLRWYRNASFSYHETARDTLTGRDISHSYRVFGFVEPQRELVELPWGNKPAVRVLHRVYADNASSYAQMDYWVHEDHGVPVRYAREGVAFNLVAAHENGRELGTLQPT